MVGNGLKIRSIDERIWFGTVVRLMLQLHATLCSIAEREWVFSMGKTRTEFLSSLSNKTLGGLLVVRSFGGLCFDRAYSEKFSRPREPATTFLPK